MKNIYDVLNESKRKRDLMISGQDEYARWAQFMVELNKGAYADPDSKDAMQDRLYDFISYLDNEGFIDEGEFKKLLR